MACGSLLPTDDLMLPCSMDQKRLIEPKSVHVKDRHVDMTRLTKYINIDQQSVRNNNALVQFSFELVVYKSSFTVMVSWQFIIDLTWYYLHRIGLNGLGQPNPSIFIP